jgi:hypothetical protein
MPSEDGRGIGSCWGVRAVVPGIAMAELCFNLPVAIAIPDSSHI